MSTTSLWKHLQRGLVLLVREKGNRHVRHDADDGDRVAPPKCAHSFGLVDFGHIVHCVEGKLHRVGMMGCLAHAFTVLTIATSARGRCF